MHNIRITRELNNIQLEISDVTKGHLTSRQEQLIGNCLHLFNQNDILLQSISTKYKKQESAPTSFNIAKLNKQQEIYLNKLQVELKAINYDLEILAQKVNRIIQL